MIAPQWVTKSVGISYSFLLEIHFVGSDKDVFPYAGAAMSSMRYGGVMVLYMTITLSGCQAISAGNVGFNALIVCSTESEYPLTPRGGEYGKRIYSSRSTKKQKYGPHCNRRGTHSP